MSDPFFFGYGSLVNRATHDFAQSQPAQITGWRRAWRHTGLREVAFLSAVRDASAQIDGLIAAVPGADWAGLDAREWAYERHKVCHQVTHQAGDDLQVHVYAVPDHRAAPPSTRHPILLSYIDTVVQGYLQVYGVAGAERFFATTDGWDTAILNDRADPRYPRAQRVTDAERDFIDGWLARLSPTAMEKL